MRRYRIPTLVLATTLVAGLLLALVIALAVVVAMRESAPRLDAGTYRLVRELILWATLAWVPFGALIAWYVGRRIAERLEMTRGFARDLAWSEQAPLRPPTRIADVRRLEEALAGYFADVRDELSAAIQHRDDALFLVNAVGEGLIQLDPAGHVVRLNPAAARLLKLPGEALGHPVSALIRHPGLRSLLERPAPEDAAESSELDVEGRQLLVLRQPLTCRAGGAGTIVLIVDLTPLRKLEDVRRDFVANVSHELKTPLTAIRGYLETLQDDEIEPTLRAQFLEAALRNSERLRRIVDELLDLSRIESGGWRPHLAALDACAAAREAWSAFGQRAAEHGIDFAVAAEDACPAVSADPDGLRQILSNLYDNALRYTPDGGHIRVSVGHTPEGPVAIGVSDNGTGIPAEALPRIFERFYRVDPSRSREAGGTGLGLSIVKHLAERMGGEVIAESRLGVGTTVRVTLPAAAPRLATARAEHP